MRTCINGATTMPYPLVEDIRAAAAAGFEGAEIWVGKLNTYLEGHSVADLRRLLQSTGLAVPALCPLGVAYGDQATQSRAAIARMAEIAAEIGCPTLLVCLSGAPAGASHEEAIDIAAAETARCAEVAAEFGVKIAIEPLGNHPLVPGPKEALAIAERAGRENVGIMMDTFHYYKSRVPMADIAAIPVGKLLICHVNGCDDKPTQALQDSDRLYPGLGVIPAADMLRPLMRAGYKGFLSVEIFRREYWERPIDEIAQQSKIHLDRLVAKIAFPTSAGTLSNCSISSGAGPHSC